MTPVPRDHHSGSPEAVAIGCTCTYVTNLGGMGTVELDEWDIRAKRQAKRFWDVDVTCRVHGGGKFVPFVAGREKKR